jgi:hypothetical protein
VSWGVVIALRVKANGNTVNSDIEFFADSARTDRIYWAQARNCYTAPHHVDRTAWACFSFTNELEDDFIYYQITNYGANASTYEIAFVGIGS